MSLVRKIIKHRFPMRIEKAQPSGQRNTFTLGMRFLDLHVRFYLSHRTHNVETTLKQHHDVGLTFS